MSPLGFHNQWCHRSKILGILESPAEDTMNNSTFADQLLPLFVLELIRSDSIGAKGKFYSSVRDMRMRKTGCTHAFTALSEGVRPRLSPPRLKETPGLLSMERGPWRGQRLQTSYKSQAAEPRARGAPGSVSWQTRRTHCTHRRHKEKVALSRHQGSALDGVQRGAPFLRVNILQ